MIPKVIHQIWIGDKVKPQECMDSVKRDNPNYEYKLWTEKELKTLKMSKKYQLKIKCMEELCGKADMYRYLILQQHGGICIDADSISIEPLEDFMFNKPCVAWENEIVRQGLLALGFIGFPPNHKIIDEIIEHIETNKIESPAWVHTGNMVLTKIMEKQEFKKDEINAFPSYFFFPDHHTGHKYKGHAKVYMTQLWGSTHDKYDSKIDITLPSHLLEPKYSITICIPEGTSKSKIKEIISGIKNMHGHYNIEIKCEEDIIPLLKGTRFISQI